MNTPSYVDGPQRTFAFAADTEPYLRVKIDSNGEAAIAGASDQCVGVCWHNGVDISEEVNGDVRFRHATGTILMKTSASISVGGSVYAAASGLVAGTGTVIEGVKLGDQAAVSGDVIEVLPTTL